jgi:hypothetical protein
MRASSFQFCQLVLEDGNRDRPRGVQKVEHLDGFARNTASTSVSSYGPDALIDRAAEISFVRPKAVPPIRSFTQGYFTP